MKNNQSRWLKMLSDDIQKNPGYYSNWAQVMALQIRPPYEIAIVGNDWQQKLSVLQKNYLPNAVYLGGNNEGIFLCWRIN